MPEAKPLSEPVSDPEATTALAVSTVASKRAHNTRQNERQVCAVLAGRELPGGWELRGIWFIAPRRTIDPAQA